jgi:hypothetical protein
MAQTGSAVGTVIRWDGDRGGAVLDAQECPGGCWADASVVDHATHGPGELRAGQVVRFDWVEDPAGSLPFRATSVAPGEDLQSTPGA